MTEAIIDILDRNQDKFIGINESNLHSAEEINRLAKRLRSTTLTIYQNQH